MTQFVRYVIVGALSNAGGYLMYLLITELGVAPKMAMTGLYVGVASIGFFGNRRWTFAYHGPITSNLVRYGIAHLCGYLLNLGLLIFFVDRLGFPHQFVQAVAIFVIALFLLIMFRFFVFPRSAHFASRPL